jgi:hypothetical protein
MSNTKHPKVGQRVVCAAAGPYPVAAGTTGIVRDVYSVQGRVHMWVDWAGGETHSIQQDLTKM